MNVFPLTRLLIALLLSFALSTISLPADSIANAKCWLQTDAQQDEDLLPRTIAESSGFKATSRSEEVIQFVGQCDEMAEHVVSFEFGETIEGKPMLAAQVANPAFDPDSPDERFVALIIGNIHSGECAGKEALLRMLRELTHDPDHPWLSNMVILFVPNYNADGNDKIDTGNRPGQVGPEAGMGVRTNSQSLDLNRDFMKLESPEAQSLVGLMNKFDPELFIDCHTTNGSRHQYCLTYDVPHNPTAPQSIVDFLRNRMMPTVTERMAHEDKHAFYYGNLNRDRSRWTTYGYEPRYSTEYFGLRGGLAILSEAYSYISYEDRIEATHSFVTQCLDYCHEQAAEIEQIIATDRAEFMASAIRPTVDDPIIQLSLDAELVAFEDPILIMGYEGDEPADLPVSFFGKYVSSSSRTLPYAYLIPASMPEIIEKLKQHGIQVEELAEPVECSVEQTLCERFQLRERSFQGHQMATFTGQPSESKQTIESGTYVVRTAQPLGRLAGYLLDPRSNDGLTTWNFFDDHIAEGEPHPIRAIIETSLLELNN